MLHQFTKEECKFIGLYVLTHWGSTLQFTESGSTKISDPQQLLELRDILQTQYQDGITAIPDAQLNSDGSFSGIFEDKVSSQLTKRFKFIIFANDIISYKLLNANDVENFGELEFAAVAKKKKNCVKGISCGRTCIAATKVCRKAPDAETKKKLNKLRNRNTKASQTAQVSAIPPEIFAKIKDSPEEIKRVTEIIKTLKSDNWNDDYIKTFVKHVVGIRAAGITDRLPAKMTSDPDNITILKDENGRKFDHLRGKNSIMKDFEEYLGKNGGDYSIVGKYLQGQTTSSWSDASQAYKYHLANQRSTSNDDYYWQDGKNKAEMAYKEYIDKFGKDKYTESMAAYHAFNYEMLSKIDLPNKNPDGTVTILRTENKEVMEMNGLKVGDKNVTMKRGVAESTSLVKEVSVYGTELTAQRVPIHRIVSSYLHERYPGKGGSALMGDTENELVAILDKVPFNYTKTVSK
ncbi:hypothetical protein [Fischerella thermalis]|uniref:hypothetical protein n=1 Tax=Fischerella thermalis TaxID=372787 RepID=UPI000C7F9B9B|nr:hypothetical protein [Fischerella thermalis]PLZ11277.1 hypothetical protein CBP19_13150 [Fischerella thermalis WC1110]PLZ41828.1 hypothetical protein CBP26_08765 [Fischerella thermalis WC538]PLZ44067.1 hypothetical protein CBP25_11110 [Fischerella thermalis WC527]PLZ58983.1 hypothetical protein CBP23_21130 [Fischerella thermalis WC344]RDH49773.1 hypothetical protein CA946_09780 [Fischerella thermalis 111/344/542]